MELKNNHLTLKGFNDVVTTMYKTAAKRTFEKTSLYCKYYTIPRHMRIIFIGAYFKIPVNKRDKARNLLGTT